MALTGVFGLVSSVGVAYQVIDIRRRSRRQTVEIGPESGVPGARSAAPGAAAVVTTPSPEPYRAPTQPAQVYPSAGTTQVPSAMPRPVAAPLPSYSVVPPPLAPSQQQPRVPEPTSPSLAPAPVVGIPHQIGQVSSYGQTASPMVGGATNAPAMPRILRRGQVLLLLLTVLMFSNAVLFAIAMSADPVVRDDGTVSDTPFVVNAIGILIILTPLAIVPTVLSRLIGRGRNWARIAATVVLLIQGVLCSCFGLGPFALIADAPNASGVVAYIGLGLMTLAYGLISLWVSVLLLRPNSLAYFRAIDQWRRAGGAK